MENNLPRGLRNNNPLNMRIGESAFTGEIKPGTDRSFRQFQTMAYGYRAAFRQMELYLGRGLNTIEKIITTWSPPEENHTQAYIAMVCAHTGIASTKVLTLHSGEDFIRIVAAMSYVENGQQPVMADVLAGFALQTAITR
ncbi:MAG: structural protein P5 [Bacteroidales bacterium]|jgi:hypothetical protein|nr:structural protein P5 [Bacteroidales bacterium]